MPIISGAAGNCLSSLASIDYWISVLNSDVSASARTGYKTSKITFGGGATRNDKPYANGALGIQYAEQSLSVGSTNIDFSEGQVVASTEFTHAAIGGSQNTFFTLVDKIAGPTLAANGTNNAPVATAKFFLTRDGEFHRDQYGYLVNANGLYVLGAQSVGGVLKNTAVNIPTTDANPEQTMAKIVDNHNLSTPVASMANLEFSYAHAFVNDLQSLKYSKYGSTVLEAQNSNYVAAGFPTGGFTISAGPVPPAGTSVPSATVNGISFHQSATYIGQPDSQKVRVSGSSLEASNVQLPSTLVELSLAQKIYSALTKVIQVDQQKLDGVLNLIR